MNGSQATFVTRIASDPWRALGLAELEATAQIVVIDGLIMTHVVTLSPEAVRSLMEAPRTSSALGGLGPAR